MPVVPASPAVVVSTIEKQTKKIVVIGDSIAYGEDDGTSWRADMDVMLRDRGIEPVWIVAAVGGSGCDFWVRPIRDLVRTNRPDIVLISCGTNDDQGSPAKSNMFLANHLSLILHARIVGAQVGVSSIQMSRVDHRPSLAWLPGFQRKTNPLIRANVARFDDLAFADLEAIPATRENNPDGVHPGPAGMRLYAAAWISAGAARGWWPA